MSSLGRDLLRLYSAAKAAKEARDVDKIQEATLAALEHLAKHGNIRVLEPLWHLTRSFKPALARQWRQYVLAHSFLDFNPNGLPTRAITKAQFVDIWVKNRAKEMSLEAARNTKWFEFALDRQEEIIAVDIEIYAKGVVERLQSKIANRQLRRNGELVEAAEVRRIFVQLLETLVDAETVRQVSEAREKHTKTRIASAPGTPRRGSPTVSGGLPSLGKRR